MTNGGRPLGADMPAWRPVFGWNTNRDKPQGMSDEAKRGKWLADLAALFVSPATPSDGRQSQLFWIQYERCEASAPPEDYWTAMLLPRFGGIGQEIIFQAVLTGQTR